MLKGTATIELTDVKTGRKEVVKHDNLVTNAIHDLLTLNPLGMRFRSYANTNNNTSDLSEEDMYHELGASFEAGMLPICPKAIGGILLYEKALEEDPTKYYAPMSNPLVGYSSNDTNATTDTRRGSMNPTESGPLEDGSGYRFVFDFATTQANGVISAVGLTSERGGKAGYGAPEDKVGYPMLVVDSVDSSVEVDGPYNTDEWYTRNSLVAMDAEKGILYYARVLTANTIAVGKLAFPVDNLGLTKNTACPPVPLEETVLTTNAFAAIASTTHNYMGRSRQYSFVGTFVDSEDGYIWGFQHQHNFCGNENGSATVLWIKISKEDFSFTEGQWELDAQLFPLGFSEYNEAGKFSYNQKQMWNNAVIKDGRLYALKYDRMGVYSINLENVTDMELMACDFPIYVSDTSYAGYFNKNNTYYYYVAFNTNVIDIGCEILYRNAYINDGKIWPVGYGTRVDEYPSGSYRSKNSGLRCNSMTRAHYGPFFLNYYSYYYSSDSTQRYHNYPVVWLRTPYLATINNLSKPVEKTADKTMKITYILREEVVVDESDQQTDPALG